MKLFLIVIKVFALVALLLALLTTFDDVVANSFKSIELDELQLIKVEESHLELLMLPLEALLLFF